MKYFIILAAVGLSACVEEQVDGRAAFVADCAGCHGMQAKGDGDMAHLLATAPPDLTLIASRNGGVFARNSVMSTIDGLNRDAHFSAAMPEFGAADMGPLVMVEENGLATPIPQRLLALADYLESIQQ